MAETLTPDLCVIGGGSSGLAVATAARGLGASVVVVERGKLGGSGLAGGGAASKALIESGRRAHAMRTATPFGVAAEEPKAHFGRIRDHLQDVIASRTPTDSAERLAALGIDVIAAEGRFLDRQTISAGDTQIRARRFVIATGSKPIVPSIDGLSTVPYFTGETIFGNTRKPSHIVVIGAGALGLEIGQAYRRLGADVTVVDPGLLPDSDPELAAVVLGRVNEEGVDVRKASVLSVALRNPGVTVTVKEGETEEAIAASHLFVALGKTPDLDALDLDRAGIKRSRADAALLRLRPNLLTSNGRVYAAGDAASGIRFSHLTGPQAGVIARHALLGVPVRYDPQAGPVAVYTDPEIAEVGLTEAMARKRLKSRFRVLRASFADNDRARAARQSHGLAKLIVSPEGHILGAGIVGPQAGELIGLYAFCIANGLSVKHLQKFAAPYPTLSEIAGPLAAEFAGGATENPLQRQLLAFRRMLP